MQALSGNKLISPLVVKQRIDALCKASVGQPALDQHSIHAKAQFISNAEVFTCIFVLVFHAAVIEILQAQSTAAMQKKRDEANPARSDPAIASAIIGVPGGALNADGMPALALRHVPRVPAAHPAVVQIENLIPADGGARVRPIQTGHSTNKRRAALIAVAAGDNSPATKSRNTDSMIANFQTLQQEGLQTKAVKAQAALITAKAAQIQNQLQTLMFFEKQPDSELKRLITSNAKQSLAELSKPDVSYSPRTVPGGQVHSDNIPADDISDSSSLEDVVVEKECSICQENIMENAPSMVTPCLHTFHFGCLRTWLLRNDTCPHCRGSLANSNHSQEHQEPQDR